MSSDNLYKNLDKNLYQIFLSKKRTDIRKLKNLILQSPQKINFKEEKMKIGRGGGIRTHDPLLPKQMR